MEDLKTNKVVMSIEDITSNELQSFKVGESKITKKLSSKDVVNIPEAYKYEVAYHLKIDNEASVTVSDLSSISKMTLVILDNSDLDWLKYCDNLTNLDIILNVVPESLNQIGCLSNLKYLSIFAQKNTVILTKENFDFVRKCYNLSSLALYNINIEKNFLTKLNNIEDLILSIEDDNRFDYKQLKNIKNLIIVNSNPYDIAVSLTNEDLSHLKENSINLALSKESIFKEIQDINSVLDNMVLELEIKESDSEEEKLNKIIVYVLEKLKYDQDIINTSSENIETYLFKYYSQGTLYATLNLEKSISANYAVLIIALMNRTGLKDYNASNFTGDWNLIKVENEFYYVDSSFLNSEVKTVQNVVTDDMNAITFEVVKASNLDKKVNENKGNLNIEINPATVTLSDEVIDLEKDKNEFKVDDITSKKYNLKIGKKRYIVCGGVLIGILTGLGVAIGITKNQKQIKRMKEEYNVLNFDYKNKNNYCILSLDK